MTARFPLVLPHRQIRLMIDRRPSLLPLTRELKIHHSYEVHDALTIRRNRSHQRNGRDDLVDDPFVFSIEITALQTVALYDLDLKTVMRTGFKTLEDFYLDWLERRREAINVEVSLYGYEILQDIRYLHERVHRGYTRDPLQAPQNERDPAPSAEELNELARENRARYQAEHSNELARRQSRSLANQLREATARATLRGVDITPEITSIQRQLDQIRNKTGAQAA